MSVSEGVKKYGSNNYYVKLFSLGSEDEIQESKKGVKIQPWTKVAQLKTKVGKYYNVKTKNIRLYYCNIEMLDDLTMLDYQIIDVKRPEIYYQISSTKESSLNISVYAAFPCTSIQKRIIEDIRHGFLEGLAPTLIMEGTSGTYNLRNTNKDVVGLFKPIDEEAFAPNNQKGYTGKFGQESFRKGILSGEGSIREVSAFLLDKANYFSVPETTFVEVSHPVFNKNVNELLSIEDQSLPKLRNSIIHNFILENLVSTGMILNNLKNLNKKTDSDKNIINASGANSSECQYIKKKYGSLQRFIKSNDVAANFSYSLFDPIEVHKIGVIDIRILNCDRNDENILVVKKKDKITGKSYYKLVPIDHSLSFPDCIKIQEYEMCWMGWEQAQMPFSKEMLNYIKKIDIISDMNRMSAVIKLRDKCWKNFRIANIVLKIGAEMGLTLYDIGMLLYKPGFDEDTPSEIENLIEKTEEIFNKETLTNIFFNSGKIENEDDTKEIKGRHNSYFIEDEIKDNLKKLSIHSDTTMQTNYEQSLNSWVSTDEVANELNQNTDILLNEVSKKSKKNSLLKRTASEPQLLKIESTPELNEQPIEIDNSEYISLKAPEIFLSKERKINVSKKSYKEQFNMNNNVAEKVNKKEKDMESPFNEIFFYNFENVLVEFIDKKYKLNINSYKYS